MATRWFSQMILRVTDVCFLLQGVDGTNGPELAPSVAAGRTPLLPQSSSGQAGGRSGHILVQVVQEIPLKLSSSSSNKPRKQTIFRASNVDGSVTSRKANLDIAVLRGEFPEEPLDTWVAQRGEVRSYLELGFQQILPLRWNYRAPHPRATLPQRCPGAGMESPST